MKLQKQTTERLPIPPYQLRVLKEFATDFKLCQVTLLEQEGMILFHGNEEDCANAKCIFLTQIQVTTLPGSSELFALKTQLESDLLVLLTLPVSGSSELLVEGINGDVDMAVREVQKHMETNKLGRRLFKSCSREFRPYTTTIGNTTVKIKTGDISREKVEILVSIVGEDLQMKGTAVGGAILKRFPDVAQAVTGKAKFEASVCTRNQGDVPAVKALLLKELKSTFLWLDTVKDLATFKKLGTKAMDEIQAAAMKENVILRVYEKDGKVTACGQKADVGQVVSLIKDKILKYMSQEKQERGPSRRKHKVTGLPANTADIPSYWKICQKGVVRGIQEAIRNMRKLGALHSVDSQEQKAIEQLIQDTWMPQFIGHGKDGVGLAHTNIQLVKVERLENPELWEKYSMLREACIRQLEFNKQSGFTPVEKLPGSKGPVKTTTTLRRGSPLRREVYPLQVNEHYLFHGTKKEYIDAIVKDGLDSRISSPNSMLGRGIYASESATKADQYTDKDL
nr:hypothetical protein BaRGS_005087 [Batillaria attramentaria]